MIETKTLSPSLILKENGILPEMYNDILSVT